MLQTRPTSRKSKERDIIREHLIHRDRLFRVSSRIDNSQPRSMTHVKNNLKGKMIEKGRKDEINTSNKILVNKLMRVNSRDTSLTSLSLRGNFLNRSKKFEEICKITNENFRILTKIKTSKPHYPSKRLNQEYRYASTLKNRISKTSGRVPRIINYTQIEYNPNPPLDGKRSNRTYQNFGKLENLI